MTISAPRQRVVLATLLLSPNKVVSVDRIARFVWDDALPRSAAATIRTYVMRLRQVLSPSGADRIQTRAPGYLIQVQESDTDLGRFFAYRRAAKALAEAGDLEGAVAELDRGLTLWRHDPFVDVPSPRLHESEGAHLRELRLQAVGWKVDMQLELRRHAEVLPELQRIVHEQPLNEAFVGRLMLALFRAGRQPEALELFQRIRADLISQFGMEPGGELCEIQRRILRGEDEAAAATVPAQRGDEPPAGENTDPETPVPAQLPPDVRDFIGRSRETRELHELLTSPAAARQPVAVITGAAGVGKTSLLLRVAHAARDDFPDGQLYATFEGAQGSSVDPACVAVSFLIALGLSPSAIPDEDADRLALYRSVIAQRRVLIVLDGVCDASQVRPLMPGSGDSRVLVGSRGRLADLDGSRTVALDPLDENAALELLAGIIGRVRVDAEAEAARSIVRACCGLPLALRIAGVRLLNRPHRSLDDVARRLADPERILDELHVGDMAVRSALERVYHALVHRSRDGTDLRTVFRRLCMTRRRCIRPQAVAVLLECSRQHAEELLDNLVDAHLIRAQEGGHYTMDRLNSAFACERMYQEELAGYYVAALRRLSRHGYPVDTPWRPGPSLHSLRVVPPRAM